MCIVCVEVCVEGDLTLELLSVLQYHPQGFSLAFPKTSGQSYHRYFSYLIVISVGKICKNKKSKKKNYHKTAERTTFQLWSFAVTAQLGSCISLQPHFKMFPAKSKDFSTYCKILKMAPVALVSCCSFRSRLQLKMLQRYFVIEKGIYCLWLLTFPYVVSSVSRICPSEIKEHIPQEKRSWGGEMFCLDPQQFMVQLHKCLYGVSVMGQL